MYLDDASCGMTFLCCCDNERDSKIKIAVEKMGHKQAEEWKKGK